MGEGPPRSHAVPGPLDDRNPAVPPLPFIVKIAAGLLAGLLAGGPLVALADRLTLSRCPGAADGPPTGGPGQTTGFRARGPAAGPVRAAAGVGFALVASRFEPWWQVGPYLALVSVLIVVSVVDLRIRRLPNSVLWPAVGAGLVIAAGLGFSGLAGGPESLAAALAGAGLLAGIIGAIHLALPAGMGRGDIKLALLLGLAVGWTQTSAPAAIILVVDALVLASLFGLVHAAATGALRDRRHQVPFGPSLAAGSLVVILVAPALIP